MGATDQPENKHTNLFIVQNAYPELPEYETFNDNESDTLSESDESYLEDFNLGHIIYIDTDESDSSESDTEEPNLRYLCIECNRIPTHEEYDI